MTRTTAQKKQRSRSNRGPAAAQENREALLAAARRVFAERGYHVPLSAIAKAAGVGQAVLYRHFPTRLALADAVFEDNLRAYEALVEVPGPRCVHALWSKVCDNLIDSVAFIEMVVDARREAPAVEAMERMAAIVERAVAPAVAAGCVPADFTAQEFLLGLRMAYGISITSVGVDAAELKATLRAALPRLPP